MSETLRVVVGALLAGAGAALLGVALLGAGSRLPRNRLAGVRTAATLASDATFALANRVAALPLAAAGAVGLGGGTAAVLAGTGAAGWVVLALAGVGTVVLAGIGGAAGDRAAAGLAAPPSCTGTCAGCELVAGCRPGAAGGPGAADVG